MAFQHGKSSYLNLDTTAAGGSPTDVSAYVNNIDFPQTTDTHETTSFGATAKTYLVGLKDATFSISGNWDPTMDGYLSTLLTPTASTTFVIGPQGSTAAQIKYTGECWLTSYSVGDPVGDLVTYSADFQITGAVTRTTF